MAEAEMMKAATSHGVAPKPVQEWFLQMSDSGDNHIHIPKKYLNRPPVNNNTAVDDGSSPMMEAAVIDLSLLCSPSASQRADELAKLRSVLTTWGCFQLVNHGMSTSFLDQVRQAGEQFFALPQEEKNKYARHADKFDGYGTDTAYGENKIDWSDRLELFVHPESARKLQFWPQNPHNFRDILDEFTTKSKQIIAGVLKVMALLLNVEENSFIDLYGEEPLMLARFNYYPPCPRPDQVFGSRPHTDGSAITVLLQDREVEALQVQKDEEWFTVVTIPDALLIIVGDQMEMMSNGFLKSAFHRVITKANRDRISLAMFGFPQADIEIKPPTKLITEERPQLFKTIKNYGLIYYQIDPSGDKRPLDLARVQKV